MISSGRLGKVEPGEWCLLFSGSKQEVTVQSNGWIEAGFTVRVVRGRKMRHYHPLFDEFAAALQYPWYFGENGNAFDECITDLSWLSSGRGYVVVVTDAGDTLVDTNDDGLSWLIGSLSRAAEEWAAGIQLGESWDRPPVPFHVVMQVERADEDAALARWADAGMQPDSSA